MKINKKYKNQIIDFLMLSSSLHDLLEIMGNICGNLDLDYLNPKIKHFRYFQFTFFGLMVKAKGLLDKMIYKSEFLKKKFLEFSEIHLLLSELKKKMENAYNLINEKNMKEGKARIKEVADKYAMIFEKIKLLHEINT